MNASQFPKVGILPVQLFTYLDFRRNSARNQSVGYCLCDAPRKHRGPVADEQDTNEIVVRDSVKTMVSAQRCL